MWREGACGSLAPTFILEVAFLPVPGGNGGVHCLREERGKDGALGTGRGLSHRVGGWLSPLGPGVLAPSGGRASVHVAREEENVLTGSQTCFLAGLLEKEKIHVCGRTISSY